ncbi:MAG: flagellar hook-basal body complex protein [Thermodesulfobacterium sp.]|nr:flagellar hook-basal body complex protein [Thermodesulfobacterium sp.]
MSLIGSLFISYSGLYTNTIATKVTADNLSNLNTTGFKGSRCEFLNEVVGSNQEVMRCEGYGSFVKSISTIYTQGGLQTTDIPTDLAILGKGFFIVKDSKGNIFYTRDGQFYVNEVDENNFALQNSLGMYLLGAEPDAKTMDLNVLKPYLIPKLMPPKGSSKISAQLIFDSRITANTRNLLENYSFDKDNPLVPLKDGEYDYVWEFTIYDTYGTKVNLRLYADRGENINEYEVLLSLSDPTLDKRGEGPYKGAFLYGKLTFGAAGDVISAEFSQISDTEGTLTPIDLIQTGYPEFILNLEGNNQKITLDLGFKVREDGTIERKINASALMANAFSQLFYDQDGYPLGVFDRIEIITEEGLIIAWYTNQQQADVSRIFLADFTGYEGSLEKVGNNLFRTKVGIKPFIFAPSSSERGRIMSGALETSNVDIANEMLNLIVLQRAFQSNARVMTTADQMMEDFIRQV